METNLGKEALPARCEGCNQQGEIFVDDPEQPCFVLCERCDYETSYVWCPNCEMGGSFVENLQDHPQSWKCPRCKTEYPLSIDFYKKPVTLYLEGDASTLPGIQVRKWFFIVPYLGILAGIVLLGGNTIEAYLASALVGVVGLVLMLIPGSWYVEIPKDTRSRTDRVVAVITIGSLLLVGSLVILVSPIWGSVIVLFIVALSLFLIWITRRSRKTGSAF